MEHSTYCCTYIDLTKAFNRWLDERFEPQDKDFLSASQWFSYTHPSKYESRLKEWAISNVMDGKLKLHPNLHHILDNTRLFNALSKSEYRIL